MIYLIKTALVLLFLIVLYLIARKQNKQGGRITILEDKAKYPLFTVNGTVPTINMPPTVLDKEPLFKSKIKKEEKRISKIKNK